MEFLGVAASALTLFGSAVNNTKALAQTVSALKHSSRDTRSIASAIQSLQTVLEQLQASIDIAKSEVDVAKMEELVKTCTEDVSRYTKELEAFQKQPSDSKWTRGLKKAKIAMIGEKDFARILEGLNRHCSVLNFQLNHLNTNDTLVIKQNVLDLNTTSAACIQNDGAQLQLLQQSHADITIVRDRMNTIPEFVADSIRQTLASVTQNISNGSQVSQAQSKDILALLNTLQTQVAGLPHQMLITQKAIHAIQASKNEAARNEGDVEDLDDAFEFAESIGRLRQLASQKAGTVHDEEAELIISDLGCLLKTAFESGGEQDHTSSKRKRKVPTPCDEIDHRELEHLRSLVEFSDQIGVNTGILRSRIPENVELIQIHRHKEIIGQRFRTVIRLTERKLRKLAGKLSNSSESADFLQSIARVKVILEHSRSPIAILAHLCYTRTLTGFSILYPAISVGRILLENSPIFDVVKNGDINELQRLLDNRQCTLWDTDEHGRSLLHYAVYYKSPIMCKFFIEHGADVDEQAPHFVFEYDPAPLCLATRAVPLEALQCQKLLLQAGADPTITYNDSIPKVRSAFFAFYESIVVEMLIVMLSEASQFVDLQSRYGGGKTTLLRLAFYYNVSSTSNFASAVSLLINRGADIRARAYDGKTFLHIFLEGLCLPGDQGGVEVVLSLIHRGADIQAVDDSGTSIFDVAYKYTDYDRKYGIGGRRGDLWDACLARCGYENLIRDHRIPIYDMNYGRKEFEKLWNGIEKLCPYYNVCPAEHDYTSTKGEFSDYGKYCKGVQEVSESESEVESVTGSLAVEVDDDLP